MNKLTEYDNNRLGAWAALFLAINTSRNFDAAQSNASSVSCCVTAIQLRNHFKRTH